MQLLYQTHSPYARKVLVMAHEAGLAGRIEVIHHETSPTRRNDTVFAANPLGKVPVLVCDDGLALFDSVVICDHLDSLHDGPKLIPAAAGRARALTLRSQAIAQGLADAGIALRWETERRPEALRYPALAEGQAAKLVAAYDFIESEVDLDGPVDLGQIALATTLSWLEFRRLPPFRPGRPRLSAWYDAFSRRPSMLATPLEGETQD
ncbi:glutathione S-transferase [Inquilinus ginsengisoli]|uniref:Glutathione S-transferase n=1 Tax=Inquilinus ginsengisoli TaxID=363840 RepID=A0ABU1JVF0_9PROT|nr:glutathione S-transferase family protein [Inquilinus ginsengisoli]MDR6292596.1 glutathione S-transferase [Inquilinus ginsengisoli]